MGSGSRIDPRQYDRIPLSVHVDLQVEGRDATLRYRTTNVGDGGVFIETDAPLPVGVEVKALFHLSKEHLKLEVSGRVVRSETKPSAGMPRKGMAVAFTEDRPLGWLFVRCVLMAAGGMSTPETARPPGGTA